MPFPTVNANLSSLASEVVEFILMNGYDLNQVYNLFKDTDTFEEVRSACFEAVNSIWGEDAAKKYVRGTGKVNTYTKREPKKIVRIVESNNLF